MHINAASFSFDGHRYICKLNGNGLLERLWHSYNWWIGDEFCADRARGLASIFVKVTVFKYTIVTFFTSNLKVYMKIDSYLNLFK